MTTNNGCSLTPQSGQEATSLFFTKAPGEDYYKVYARYGNDPTWIPIHMASDTGITLQQARDANRNISMNSGSYEDAHFYLRSADGNNMTAAFFTNAEGAAIQSGNAHGFTDLNLQPEGGTLNYGGEEVATKEWVSAQEEADPVYTASVPDQVMYKGLIPAGANLNTYTTTGRYLQNGDANAAGGTNYPAPYAGMLEVTNANGGEFIFQTYTTYKTAGTVVWKRSFYYGWSAWEQLAGAGELVTWGTNWSGNMYNGYKGNSVLYNSPWIGTPDGGAGMSWNAAVNNDSGIYSAQMYIGMSASPGGPLDSFFYRANQQGGPGWPTPWFQVASREWVDTTLSNAPFSGQIVKSSGAAGAHTVQAEYDFYATSTPADYSDNLTGAGGVITELRGNANVDLPTTWSGISMVQTIPQFKTGSGGGGVHQIAYPDGGNGPKYRFALAGASTWGPWRDFVMAGGNDFINNQNSNWENGNFKILGTGATLRLVASDDDGYSRVSIGSVGAGNVNSVVPGGGAAGSSLSILGDYMNYGTFFGVNTATGDGWLQSCSRVNNITYNFIMQAAGGNVGIGGVPTEKLHVFGNTKATGKVISGTGAGFQNGGLLTNAANPIWSFAQYPNYGMAYYEGTALASGDGIGFHFGNINEPKAVITLDGNLINRHTFSQRVIAGKDNGGTVLSASGTHSSGMTLGSATATAFGILNSGGHYGLYFGVNDGTGDTWMQSGRTDGNTSVYNIVMQTAGGNVGVGTPSPTEKLHVDGSIRQTAVTSSVLKADSDGKIVAATAGTDYAAISRGTHIIVGDGTTTSFTIPHSLGHTPGSVSITPKSALANKIWFDCSGFVPDMDALDITVAFNAPPANGVSYEYWWTVYQ